MHMSSSICCLRRSSVVALHCSACGESCVDPELGEIVNGTKIGREGDELIVCDLTGTGAQDAAIGQVHTHR